VLPDSTVVGRIFKVKDAPVSYTELATIGSTLLVV